MLMNSRIVQNIRGNFGFLSMFQTNDNEFSDMSEPKDWGGGGGPYKCLQVVIFPP